VPLQQPDGQDVELQTHFPVLVSHACPELHDLHMTPFEPHDPNDSLASASHVVALVQQPVQRVPLHVHTPLKHESPVLHGPHVAPVVPHERLDCAA
jgi:hypothetical protein